MDSVTQPLQSGVSGIVNTVKSVGDDVVSVEFYKSPALYILLTYVGILIGLKFYMNKNTVDSYLLGANTDLDLFDLFSFPYGINSPENIIKTMISNPYIIYLFVFTIMYPGFMEIKKTGSKPFMYGVAVSSIMVIGLFLLHVGITKFFVNPETIKVPPQFPGKKTGRTYAELYRGHWISLFIFSPIYAFLVVYLARKLG
jgi:hypothetical protein